MERSPRRVPLIDGIHPACQRSVPETRMRRRNRQEREPEAIELRGLDRADELACAPELLSSVERGCTNFLPVVLAHYFRLPKWNRGSDEDRRECAALLPRLMAQFERGRGRRIDRDRRNPRDLGCPRGAIPGAHHAAVRLPIAGISGFAPAVGIR